MSVKAFRRFVFISIGVEDDSASFIGIFLTAFGGNSETKIIECLLIIRLFSMEIRKVRQLGQAIGPKLGFRLI